MKRRTTIEIEEDLLERARKALGFQTTRGTVEEALRRAADSAEASQAEQLEKQVALLGKLGELVDLDVLKSDEMWR
ncbi:MAG: type II toxin-antitoxin system VapB family antitoxin [Actinomycetota bacterium]